MIIIYSTLKARALSYTFHNKIDSLFKSFQRSKLCLYTFTFNVSKFIDFVGKPQFVANDLGSITIIWNSSRSMNFTVQTWNNGTSSWEDTRCNASIAVRICLVANPRATVINLKPSSVYIFRVSARDDITSPASKGIKTKELGEIIKHAKQPKCLKQTS